MTDARRCRSQRLSANSRQRAVTGRIARHTSASMGVVVVASASVNADGTGAPTKRRMLALHGKGGNARAFARQLAPLCDATSEHWEWHFADGGTIEPNPGGRGWWALRPGERTFNASELPGVEDSIAMVRETGPWAGIFGFSQGAMLAALVMAEDPSCVTECAIIAGAAWPTCVAHKLERMENGQMDVTPTRSLHIIGASDAINPPEQALRVARAFGLSASVLNHDGGHIVPMDEKSMEQYVQFINAS